MNGFFLKLNLPFSEVPKLSDVPRSWTSEPWEDWKEIYGEVDPGAFKTHAGYRAEALAHTLPILVTLAEKCLMFMPERRPKASEILANLDLIEEEANVKKSKKWPISELFSNYPPSPFLGL